jgi:ligand-binding SRPBCC domain-containing protein
MPTFEAIQTFSRPVVEVFDFFRRTANLPLVAPPELHMKIDEGPTLLELGSRLVIKGRRWGLPQRVVSQVTEFVSEVRFVDEQVEGPFKKWKHTHGFQSLPDGGTHVSDRIDFDPPGGMLGLVVTASFVEKDLKWIFEYRRQKLAELLG